MIHTHGGGTGTDLALDFFPDTPHATTATHPTAPLVPLLSLLPHPFSAQVPVSDRE